MTDIFVSTGESEDRVIFAIHLMNRHIPPVFSWIHEDAVRQTLATLRVAMFHQDTGQSFLWIQLDPVTLRQHFQPSITIVLR